MKIKLGKKYKDQVTGISGIATAYIVYITGCIHVELSPPGLDKDGKQKQTHWFDESRINPDSNILDGHFAEDALSKSMPPGGPRTSGKPEIHY